MDRLNTEAPALGLDRAEHVNVTAVAHTQRDLIHELFECQVERTPESVAVAYQNQSLTYAELNERANQLARHLRSEGVGTDCLVALCVERGVEMIVGLLGILKSGGAYVPLDPDYPVERRQTILEDSGAKVLLLQTHLSARFPGSGPVQIALDADGPGIGRQSTCNLPAAAVGARGGDLAYVIYTSGSTGNPKGVMIEHRNVLSLLEGLEEIYGRAGQCRRVAINASFSFDASVKQIVQVLSGRTIVPVPLEARWDPSLLLEFVDEQRIDCIDCTPAQLRYWLSAGLLEGKRYRPRLVLVGGEAIDQQLWAQLAEVRGTEFCNVYRPTESTVDTTFAHINGDTTAPHIGRPMKNRCVYIVDALGRPLPTGEIGELYIGGAWVARGYLHRAELSGKSFIRDPFSKDPQARLYKSGDLGRWRADGSIEFAGRNDHQVKVRGFRIELGEIESQLLRYPGVKEVAVLVREDEPGEQRLVAYVTADDDQLEAQWSAGDQTSLSSEMVSQWQVLHESTYELEQDARPPTFLGWNSSYTGESIPLEEMQEWLDCTAERIAALNPRKVLEIGCGVGLILQQIAPNCDEYWATDFSAIALARLGGWLRNQAELPHVKLLHRTATQFADLPRTMFDTVILNSVVQYFPDVAYLIDVLSGAVDAVCSGGRIFVGDLRDLRLLTSFHTSVQLERAPENLTVAQLRARIARAIAQDKELAIDPLFFVDLQHYLPRITEVEIQLKRGNAQNELTGYRYDVVLHVGEVSANRPVWGVTWRPGLSIAQQLDELLTIRSSHDVRIVGVTNGRLTRDLAACRLI